MSENRRALPKEMQVLQNQRWKGNSYTGFRCPMDCKGTTCPLTKADHLDDDEALSLLKGLYELHHKEGARFSATGTSFSSQLIMMCIDCHTLIHEHDPSASRFPRKKS